MTDSHQANDPAARPVEDAAPNGATDELTAFQARAEAAERDRDQYLALAKSTRADFENYQKRVRREDEERSRYAHTALALSLLPVLDNLERATAAAKQAGESGPLVQGVAMVEAQFLEALKRHGITRMDALGKPFDPNFHQALLQQPSAQHPPGTVLNVLMPGYMIHDRVLRPAQVAVSVAPQ